MIVEPRATYRVQLRRDFDFDATAAIVPYLAALGVSHLYCSPYMQAAAGSTHGYDVVDPTRVNGDLGGDEGLARLSEALAQHGMAQLLDIVPNHMCISDARDVWWWDTLLHGRDSPHATFFDIDWDAPGLDGRVLLPVLGAALDEVLARDELQVVPAADTHAAGGPPLLAYHDQRFPLNPSSGVDTGGDAARQLLAHQHYVLDYWRTGLTRINYRRFFDITSLAAVRAERDDVHRVTHERALELVAAGVVDGLRIDHVDGLTDPGAYTTRLRAEAPRTWLIAEKILGSGESLPRSCRSTAPPATTRRRVSPRSMSTAALARPCIASTPTTPATPRASPCTRVRAGCSRWTPC